MSDKFISLHNHSHYSALDGFSTPEQYIERALELDQVGLGITDHGSLGGIKESLDAAARLSTDFKVIPGIEIYVAPENPEGAKVKRGVFYGQPMQRSEDVSASGAYLHLTLWAKNMTGLHNLYKLNNLAWLKEHYYYKPRIDWNMLVEHKDGLIVGTGCPASEISTRIVLGQYDKALTYTYNLIDVFGRDNVYIEVMNHNMVSDVERRLVEGQLRLKKDTKLPVIATNDAHYALKGDATHHEELLCNQSGSKMCDATINQGGKRFAFDGNQYFLKTGEQMMAMATNEDLWDGAVTNTLEFAEKVDKLVLPYNPSLKPVADLYDPVSGKTFETKEEMFEFLIQDGIRRKFPESECSPEFMEKVLAQVEHENKVITSSNFIDYFLVVRDYIVASNLNSTVKADDGTILVPNTGIGRGSVGGSLLSYLLDITRLDPLRWGLIFERFMTAGRGAVLKITYDDGSEETLLESSEVKVKDKNGEVKLKYAHKLEEDDEVLEIISK